MGFFVSRDTSFYYSFLVLPPHKRRAIIAVWDFCRAVDDSVDEIAPADELEAPAVGARVSNAGWKAGLTPQAHARAAERLSAWRDELEAVYTGTPQTKQGIALQTYAREFHLPRARFEELIDGVEMDLERTRYRTFPELLDYCRHVASSVGLVCIEIFGYSSPSTRDYAVSLGIALQLTNIVRDVATDLKRGRIYLPSEDLVRFGVTETDLCAGAVTPAVRELLRFECERARGYYRRAASELPPADARSLVAAEIMGAIYFEILKRIERAGYDVFRMRIRVPRPHRALIAVAVLMRTLVRTAITQGRTA